VLPLLRAVRQAVLKVWCLPQPPQPLPAAARHWRNVSSPAAAPGGDAGSCSAAQHARNVAEHLLAQQQVVRDCGLDDINVPVRALPRQPASLPASLPACLPACVVGNAEGGRGRGLRGSMCALALYRERLEAKPAAAAAAACRAYNCLGWQLGLLG
jgi:hypothetical protein